MNNAFSKFYSQDLGGSITCRSRHTISVSGIACEAFMGKYRFRNLGAVKHLIKETKAQEYSLESLNFLNQVTVTKGQLHYHLTQNSKNIEFKDIMEMIIDELDPLTIKKLYYKNNLAAFMDTPYFKKFLDVMSDKLNDNYTSNIDKVGTLNAKGKPIGLSSAIYSDAYDIPSNSKEEFKLLEHFIDEILFGYFWYDGDYVEEAEYWSNTMEDTFAEMNRTEVGVVDTDSNNIVVDDEMKPIYEVIVKNSVIPEDNKEYYNEINAISIVTFILARFVDLALTRYKYHAQIPESAHHHIDMKNEFYFRNLFITTSRKNYIATIMVKEGRVFDKDKIKMEIKGLSLKKSGYNENIRVTATHIIEQYVFGNKNTLDLYPKMKEFKNNLIESLKSDKGIEYFTTLKIPNVLDAFDPGEHRVKAIRFWNMISPDNTIEPPTNFYVVPLVIDKEKLINEYPAEYKMMIRNLYHHLLRVNLPKPLMRITSGIRGILKEKLDSKGKKLDETLFNKMQEEINKSTAEFTHAINDAILVIEDPATLEIKLELVKKEIYAKRKELEQSIFLELQKYKGIYFTFTELNNNDVKLLRKIWEMDKYKTFFTNTNEDLVSLYSKIAMPISTVEVIKFVKDFVDPEPFVSVFDSILSPIISEIGLVCPRIDQTKRSISNIKAAF